MGLEPTTPRLEVWCAIQLRHAGEYLKEIKKVPPGFEPGLPDSKSGMLTITSRNRFLARVTRTPDKWIYSPLLCQLSYSEIKKECSMRGLNPRPSAHKTDALTNWANRANSHTGTRTRVAWVKTRYPNHLDYMGYALLPIARSLKCQMWDLNPRSICMRS